MNRVKEGDLDKLGLLFERYKRLLFSYFYGMNRNAEVSEDLVQNVFARVLKYRSGFKGEGSFKYWIFHIARNVNADHYRKNKNVRYLDVSAYEEQLESGSRADTNLEQRERLEFLNRALMRLDPDQREILMLSKIEEMKYSEIAAMMEISEGAVKVRVFRAMQELKALVNKGNGDAKIASHK